MSNYFAPSFRIEVNGSRLAADISENIQDLTIVSKPDTIDQFNFTVVNALPTMRWTHTSDSDLFKEGTAVNIWVGYMGELQLMIEGEITKISPSFPQDGMPTVAIEGQTCLHRLDGDCKARNFQKMTDTEIAEQIAQDAGLEPDAEDSHIRHDYIMQPNQTDLQFLRDRAALIQFEILVEGKKLIFRKVKEATAKIYTLVWAQTQAGFSIDATFPLKTFSLQMDAKAPATSVKLLSYDSSTKQTLVSQADSSDQTHSMGGSSKASDISSQAFGRPRQYVGVAIPFANQAEGDQKSKAILNQQALGLISGSAETIGLPDLRSGKIVELRGVGTRFEGLYSVDEATHTLDSNGYQTSFTVKRNSVS